MNSFSSEVVCRFQPIHSRLIIGLFSLLLLPLAVMAMPPTPTLQYTFDNDLSNTYAADTGVVPAANGNYFANSSASTISLTTNTPNGSGYALNLVDVNGGVNNYLECGNPDKLNNITNLTLTCWLNLQGNPAVNDRLIDKTVVSGSSTFGWNFGFQSGTSTNLSLGFTVNGDLATFVTSPAINASNQWIFLALTFNGNVSANNVVLYEGSPTNLASVISTTTLAQTSLTNNPTSVRIGSTAAATANRTPPAWIDDVRIYTNTVLSAADVEMIREQNAPSGVALTVASDVESANYGDLLTFQAAVFPTPTNGNSVSFLDGTNIIGTGLVTNGVAFLSLSNLSVGSHSLTASFYQSTDNTTNVSNVLPLIVVNPPAGFYLVWSDEFQSSTWTKNWSMFRPGPWAGADQATNRACVDSAVSSCNGTNLVLTDYSANGSNYFGMVTSEGKASFKFGYYESRILRGAASGVDQDWWLNTTQNLNGVFDGNPPYQGVEIDVNEHWGSDTGSSAPLKGEITFNLHYNGYNVNYPNSSKSPGLGSGFQSNYHTYGLLWTKTNYQCLADGVNLYSYNSPISQRSEFFIFSGAIDGGFAGSPLTDYGSLSTSTNFYKIDYIRYFAPTNSVFWGGSQDDNWRNAANWIANHLPGSGADVYFSYLSAGNPDTTLPANLNIGSLTVMETPAPISVNGGTLTLGNGGIDLNSANYDVNLNSAVVLNAEQTWAVGDELNLNVYGPVSGIHSLTIDGYGTVCLHGTNTYTGSTIISTTNTGALALCGSASIANTTNITIGPGATFDVSGLGATATFSFPENASLAAYGTGTGIGSNAATIIGGSNGIVDLGARPITLYFDGSNPALYVSQGALALASNFFTVNCTTPLAAGTYTLIQQNAGAIGSNGSLTVSGTAIAQGDVGSIQVSGTNVNLVVTVATIIVDNADPTGVITNGVWFPSTSIPGYYGTNYLQDGDAGGGKSVQFTPTLPVAGNYQVYLNWPTDSNRATNTPVDVIVGGVTNTFIINQVTNGVWRLLGTFDCGAGTNTSVTVRDDGASGYVIADAVKFAELPQTNSAPMGQFMTTNAPTYIAIVNGMLTMNWPSNYLGWILQMQTNGLNSGAQWFDLFDTSNSTSIVIPINPASPSVFYRLRQP